MEKALSVVESLELVPVMYRLLRRSGGESLLVVARASGLWRSSWQVAWYV